MFKEKTDIARVDEMNARIGCLKGLLNLVMGSRISVIAHRIDLRIQSVGIRPVGHGVLNFFDDNKEWQSLTFKDIQNKTEAEKRLAMFIGDRERGKLNLPKKTHG